MKQHLSAAHVREDAVAKTPDNHGLHLHGRWLAIARGTWIALALLLLANFIASIPAYYVRLHTICTNLAVAHCNAWQPTPGNIEALHHLNLSLNFYVTYTLSIDVAASLVFLAVGVVVFWRKSDEWMGLFVSLVLIIFGSFGISDTLAGTFITGQTPGAVKLLGNLIVVVQWPALGAFLLTFPTGRFVPRWSWVLVLFWVLQDLFFSLGNIENWPPVLFAADILLLLGSTVGIQVYRYLRVYDSMQRQQTKWLVFAFAVIGVLQVLYLAIGGLVPAFSQPDSPYWLAQATVTIFFFLLIPLSIIIAILRYRLWDIDVIINRTLVYGTLTAMLALVYAGLVIALQFLLHGLTGQASENPLAVVASTLVITALFNPLRRRIQAFIDRRFYRRKYDAARTLEAFSATLRNEVDLNRLSEQLVAVVQETMQPSHVSLWLRKADQDSKHNWMGRD